MQTKVWHISLTCDFLPSFPAGEPVSTAFAFLPNIHPKAQDLQGKASSKYSGTSFFFLCASRNAMKAIRLIMPFREQQERYGPATCKDGGARVTHDRQSAWLVNVVQGAAQGEIRAFVTLSW